MIVGRNDSGKSTVFEALSAFFGETKLDQDDACKSGDPSDVCIICEFDEFPEQIIIDKDYPTNLQAEYLLNNEGRLELHQMWDCTKKTLKPAMYAMAKHPSASNYDDLLNLKITDLKRRAKDLSVDLSSVDTKVNAQIRGAIWTSAEDLALKDTLLQLDKDSGKKVWDQLKLSLPTFALFKADRTSTDTDPEAQNPMNAAMKEAFKGLEDKLNGIVGTVKEEVQEIADKTVEKLKEMHPELASQLHARFSEPKWDKVLKVSLISDDDIPLNKRGSGVRRLVLLNFFRAKAESIAFERGDSVPVIYAVEEPETSQHPSNQKIILKALMELSESPGRQVFMTSHNPVLARRIPEGSIRYVCDADGCKTIKEGEGTVMQMIVKDMGVLPDHEVRLFIGVEGINDINFLQNMSSTLIGHGLDIPDLFKLEDEGRIVFIPCGGSNLALWAFRLAHLNRPEFHLFDGDKPQNAECAALVDARGEECVGCCTTKLEMENYLHPTAIQSACPDAAGIAFGDQDDVPLIVAQTVHAASDSEKTWNELNAKKQSRKMSQAKKWLNVNAVQAMTPDLLQKIDPNDEVLGWFRIIDDRVRVPEEVDT